MAEDTPLIPLEDARGRMAEVIDLAGIRLERGRPPYGAKPCEHARLVFDAGDRRVWCQDCERSIDNFDAFMVLATKFRKMVADVRQMNHQAEQARAATLVRRAAKEIDTIWGRKMAFGCPHCSEGLLPEDFLGGRSLMSMEILRARRERDGRAAASAEVPPSNKGPRHG